MITKCNLIRTFMAVGLLQALSAFAADLSALPPAQTQNGITYITGGVGKPESTAMKAEGGRHDLMLTFANRRSEFLANVKVNIANRQGETVLDIVSGPILLVDLPSGRYTVRADMDGYLLARTIDVGGRGHKEVAYVWPNEADQPTEFAAFETRPLGSSPSMPEASSPSLPEAMDPDTGRYGGGLDHVSGGLWSSGFQNY
jgi:hypothetical protein